MNTELNSPISADWIMVNCAQRHKENPESFPIPSDDDIAALSAGDTVKIIFEFCEKQPGRPLGERMFVRIVERHGAGFMGTLDSEPQLMVGLKADDLIAFFAHHIVQIFDPNNVADAGDGLIRRVHSDCNRLDP